MLIRKIILKDDLGAPHGIATVTEGKDALTVKVAPQGELLLALSGERPVSPRRNSDGTYALPTSNALTLVVRIGDERTFGTERNDVKPAYLKWRAETLLRTGSPTPEKSAITSDISDETPEEKSVETEAATPVQSEPAPASTAPELTTKNDPPETEPESSAPSQDAFAEGEPFPYFERLIEGSRWVKVLDGGYLLGIFREGDAEIEMVGVPGRLGTAPDDDHVWEYIPSEESEDDGYYVRRK